MRRITLPGSDLEVSRIALGTSPLGTTVATDDAFRLLDLYRRQGGNFIDTAHVYADWVGGERHMSEKTIGEWLRRTGGREDVVLATKGGHPDLDTPLVPRLAPEQVLGDLEESLDCLGVDRVDVFWLHRDDPERPVDEIVETLATAVRRGWASCVGVSNWQPDRVAAAVRCARDAGGPTLVGSQVFWSLAMANEPAFPPDHARMTPDALAFYRQAGLAIVAFTAQGRGFFSKAAAQGVDGLSPLMRDEFLNPTNERRLPVAIRIARERGVSVGAVVLAYITSQPMASVALIGPRSTGQLVESMEGADLELTSEELDELAA